MIHVHEWNPAGSLQHLDNKLLCKLEVSRFEAASAAEEDQQDSPLKSL